MHKLASQVKFHSLANSRDIRSSDIRFVASSALTGVKLTTTWTSWVCCTPRKLLMNIFDSLSGRAHTFCITNSRHLAGWQNNRKDTKHTQSALRKLACDFSVNYCKRWRIRVGCLQPRRCLAECLRDSVLYCIILYYTFSRKVQNA